MRIKIIQDLLMKEMKQYYKLHFSSPLSQNLFRLFISFVCFVSLNARKRNPTQAMHVIIKGAQIICIEFTDIISFNELTLPFPNKVLGSTGH